jgi:hypothetical protein
MNELNPEQQRIADQLQRQARAVEIGDTPIATVVQRGRQRRDRRKVVLGLTAVIALSGAAIGTIQFLSKPESRKLVPGSDSVATDEETPTLTVAGTVEISAAGIELPPVNRVESNLQWNAVAVDTSEALSGVNMGLGTGTESHQQPPYMAWSTAPGRAHPNNDQAFVPRLWRSDDGIHWQLAEASGTFTQPKVQAYGVGSRAGRLFAFGTAAATAPIPKGGGGDVVVDVSDDGGASWRHIVLPVDLRGLGKMNGVQSSGFNGSFVVGTDAVVAVAAPTVNFSQAFSQRFNGNFAFSSEGVTPMTYPVCSTDVSLASTTMVISGGMYPAETVVAVGPVGETVPAAPVPTLAGSYPYAPPVTVAADASGRCSPEQLTPLVGELTPWSDIGVDPRAVEAMFTPRVFVSSDGETFNEGSFPPPPNGYQPGAVPQIFATPTGFLGFAQFYDSLGQHPLTKLYTSADGSTWTDTNTSLDGQVNSIRPLPDGTLVALGVNYDGNSGYGMNWAATSPDGVEWTKRSLNGLLEPGDGASAALTAWQMSSGPSGISAFGQIDIDAAVEAGGFSIEKDGVRLTLTESRFTSMVATDIASGDELGKFDGRTPPTADAVLNYDQQGRFRLLNDDGTVRVTFSDQEMQSIYSGQNSSPFKTVILHTTDGVNWSRDDIAPLAGFDTTGGARLQITESNVLVSVSETTMFKPDGTPVDSTALPKTVVLVGTPKS